MEQFTANEVRATIAANRDGVTDQKMEMLRAFANRLEAHEKAVPVAHRWRCNGELTRDYWIAGVPPERALQAAKNCAGIAKWEAEYAYTHPSPSDAGRLTEALRELVSSACMDEERFGESGDEKVERILAEWQAAHSAKAQPPAAMPEQTHYVAEVIDDCRRRALDLEWDMKNKWPEWSQDEAVLGIICVAQNLQASLGSLGATMKAQPPAASVPTLRYFIGGPKAFAYVDKPEHVEAIITALCECTGDDSEDYTATDLSAAHSAQAQPPAASVPGGFVFERVNMGRGNERYVGLADGSEGTTVQEDGDGPGDTRSRLLWRIADAALAAQENPNG